MSRADDAAREPLLGEWACLGILMQAPAHGFAVAARLKPDGDIGRVWSLSRALTYRSLDLLTEAGLVHAVAEQAGIAGGTRTVLAPTATGRTRFRAWVHSPALHLRDLRSELLLKLVLAEQCGLPTKRLLSAQRARIQRIESAVASAGRDDVVALWRREAAYAALRFLDRVEHGR